MNVFSTAQNKDLVSIALFFLRITVGTFMLVHGLMKFELLVSNTQIVFPDPLGVGSLSSLRLAVFAEVFCSILLILGLITRLATIPLIITMFVAVFTIHGSDGFEKKELGGLYLLIYLFLLIAGAGKYSLDHFIYKRSKKNNPNI